MTSKTYFKFLTIFFISLSFFVVAQKASAAAPTSGLVGYWKFDEGSGTVAGDALGNNNTGVLFNSPTWTTGKVGNGALNFDGSNQYVEKDIALVSAYPFTISTWINTTNANGGATIISLVDSTANDKYQAIQVNSSCLALATSRNVGLDGASGVVSLCDGAWHNVTAVFAASNSRVIYIDGVFAGTNGTSEAYSSSINRVSIGRLGRLSPVDYFNGKVDDVRIYNRALSAQEVLDISNDTGSTVTPTPTSTPTTTPAPTSTPTSTPTPSPSPSPSPTLSGSRIFYIDYVNGSDSNNGTSKSTPWKRAPGMNGFFGSYLHQIGDQFIFKGGVTWSALSFPFIISNSGTNSATDYYGVDKSWYVGGAWVRPLFDLNYAPLSGNGVPIYIIGGYITFDNIEVAHMAVPPNYGAGSIATGNAGHVTIQNSFVHDWRPTSAIVDQDNGGIFFGDNDTLGIADKNTIGPGQDPNGSTAVYASGSCVRNGYQISNNFLTNCSDMYIGNATYIYGNTFANSKNSFQQNPTFHPNAIWHNNASGQKTYIYNNIIHDLGTQYQTMLLHAAWNGATNSSYYVFNNVAWNTNSGFNMDESGATQNCNCGYYVYNNTHAGGMRIIDRGQTYHPTFVIAQNNHFITDTFTGNGFCYGEYGCGTANTLVDSFNKTQTTASAASQGYTIANQFSPTSASNISVNAGSNLTSVGVAQLNLSIVGITRPSSGPWDIGAYQFSPNGTSIIPISGDLNLDHIINTLDYSLLNSKWNQNYSAYDLLVDGLINSFDYAILKSNWGKTW